MMYKPVGFISNIDGRDGTGEKLFACEEISCLSPVSPDYDQSGRDGAETRSFASPKSYCNVSPLRRLPVFLFIFFILFLAACQQDGDSTAVSNQPTPTPLPTPVVPEKPTYTVQRGSVVDTLEFTGRISPVQEQELFFKTDGFVDQMFVQRGDQVEGGQVLAQLEISSLDDQLAQAQLALQTAEIKLAQSEQELADSIAESEIELEKIGLQIADRQTEESNTADELSASIDLSRAQQRLADAAYEYQKAVDRHWEPEEVVDSYARGLQIAEEDLLIAEARYNDAVSGGETSYYDVRALELDQQLAELRLEKLQRGVDPLLALDVERAKLDIAEIERKIGDAQLVAPFDGEILSISARPGDNATAFKTVMVLADPTELEVTADLGGDDLSKMSIGQTAVIQLRNRPEDSFSGEVRLLPYPYGGGAVGEEDENEAARIAFDDVVELELGELATVIITLEEKDGVLWLPPAALRVFQGRDFVVIQDDDAQRRLDIRLGIESDERVEIVEGVEEGQTVVGE